MPTLLQARLKFSPVPHGTKRRLRVERERNGESRLVHDLDLGSEIKDFVVPELYEGDKVSAHLYPVSAANVMLNSSATVQITVAPSGSGNISGEGSSEEKLGYAVEEAGTDQAAGSVSAPTTASSQPSRTGPQQPLGTGPNTSPHSPQSTNLQPGQVHVGGQEGSARLGK